MRKDKDIEKIIEDIKIPPKKMPKGIKFKSRQVLMPVKFVLEKMGLEKDLNNYRTHTIAGTEELADSIESVGLIETLAFNYDTKTDTRDFSDGRGRFWSAFERGADFIEAEVFYDVPKGLWTEISLTVNATKAKIPSEDIALFTNRLYFLLEKYLKVSAIKLKKLQDKNMHFDIFSVDGSVDIAEFSKIIGRSPSTVHDYITFANMNQYVVKYVLEHPSENLFSRAVMVARKINSIQEQKRFFDYYIKKERKDYEEAKKLMEKSESFRGERLIKRMSDTRFREELDERVKDMSNAQFILTPDNGSNNGNGIVKGLIQKVALGRKNLDSFTKIVKHSPEFRQGLYGSRFSGYDSIDAYIDNLHLQLDTVLSSADPELQKKIHTIINKHQEKTFEEKILEMALKRRSEGQSLEKVVRALGGKIHYIPVSKIHLPHKQLRRHYDADVIDKMSESMEKYGQRKAGIVRKVKNHYETIVGSSRLISVRKAGILYYKAFIVNSLTPTEIGILQCMEDLHEKDTIIDRANALAKRYYSEKEKKTTGEYTPEQFAREHRNLASEKTTLNAIAFYGLFDGIKGFVSTGILGYTDAIKLSGLPKECQLETAYNIIISNPESDDLDRIINRMHLNLAHDSLFDTTDISFNSLHNSLCANTMAPISYYSSLKKIKHKIWKHNEQLFSAYATMMRSLNELRSTLYS